jgi:hypothetical protein
MEDGTSKAEAVAIEGDRILAVRGHLDLADLWSLETPGSADFISWQTLDE